MICPKYSTFSPANEHLDFFAFKEFCLINSNTVLKSAKCWAQLLLYTNISSKNTNAHFLKTSLKVAFINDWNVAGAFVRPKGNTRNS
ncbi:hypothetical protein HanRHA438_Chr11g0485171 [Helianthus annuus]|nr:hypothetical protein HanHA300_Chr11g0387381 [Helianthus annuus]KAJ0507604.1 hypothetical protein HanIR_Chr11g0508101 [Helianthus annuus]KAJ0516067.1 hypothetical protein HanHA89_Chr11g0409761 [Helianthus annuus]KAJ0816355.1 hypothetical protein HanLR1_Chr00c0550g0758841 [Helianthus annuus]KAJ0869072.1 hypothetical protein HanRHA438_Chr11g0485171 [Helianthus annuus]